MELTISLGAVSPPGNTVAYGTSVEINGIPVITREVPRQGEI